MDRPNEGIAEAGENEAPLLMTCSGGTSVIKDLHTIDLARCVVDVSRVQLLEGPKRKSGGIVWSCIPRIAQ